MSEAQTPPEAFQFTAATAATYASSRAHWEARRENILRGHGCWETWGQVPKPEAREADLEEYLPGGSEYDP